MIPAVHAFSVDWPQYRGGNHNGVSTDRIARDWSGSVTNPLWRVSLPNGLGSFTVSGGRVFTKIRRDVSGADKELCVALNAATGQELWATPVDDASFPDLGVGNDDGPRSTPSVEGDAVFVVSSYLKLYRLNVTNGATVWQKDLVALYDAHVIAWQNAASPLLEDGLIYVNANCVTNVEQNPQKPPILALTNSILALRASDGSLAWRAHNEGMTHATPVMATIHGVRQVVFATQSGLLALDPQTGDRLWRINYPFNYSTSLGASPVVFDDLVFVTGAQGYGMGSTTVRVTLSNNVWTAVQLWANPGFSSSLASHWMTPVAHQGFLYGLFGEFSFDDPRARLRCVDMATGQVKWSVNNFGRGGIALVDQHLVILTETGDLVLAKPATNAYTELGRFQAIPGYLPDFNKCWNSPAIADGKVYVRSTAFGAAFDLSLPLPPALKLDSPLTFAEGQLQLTIRTADGSPVDSNRLATLQVRATTALGPPPSSWQVLTNGLEFSNGVVRVNGLDLGAQPERYFIISEP
jgi:outer membrane protein assembly factor BamB